MIDKELSLVNKRKLIFSNLVNFIKKLFSKKETIDLKPNKKEEFFQLYRKIKNKEKNIDDLSISELIAVTQIINDEIDLKLKKIESGIIKQKQLDNEIARLKVS